MSLRWLIILSVSISWLAATSRAAYAETILTPEALLERSARHVPDILNQQERLAQARAGITKAEGAFDLQLKSDGFSRASGEWNGQSLKTRLEQPLQPLGATLYGGYRLSEGEFPIYEDEYFTNSGGEAKVGAVFSLLENRAIDARRFGLFDAAIEQQIAELELLLKRVSVQQRAASAYWRWVVAGHSLNVYRELLELAEARQRALEKQVAAGEYAEIFLTENQQNLIRRRSLVAKSRLRLQKAATALSFFYRNEQGQPILPNIRQLPARAFLDSAIPQMDLQPSAEALLAQRPELKQMEVALERARKELELSENRLLPELDLNLEVARDLGAIAEGGPTREGTDTIIRFTLSQPLQNRSAQGAVNRSRAEIRALGYEQQRVEDELRIALRDIELALETSRELAQLAADEVRQSVRMQDAEKRRFQRGDSDFFLLNRREEAVTDAKIRLLEAHGKLQIAAVNYHAVTLQLEPLGLQ